MKTQTTPERAGQFPLIVFAIFIILLTQLLCEMFSVNYKTVTKLLLTMVSVSPSNCLYCGKPVKGRTDKKFCNDYCRNNYNNQLKSTTTNLVRNINNALGKNRRILESLLAEGEDMSKANEARLIELGFQFKYITHLYTNKKGNTYYFCYDMGYLPLENGWYLIVKRKEE